MNKLIEWLRELFTSDSRVVKPQKAKFPTAKGYIVHTRDGGKLNCASQRDVADTLAALYGCPLDREHVHHALRKYKGRLAYKGHYIATIIYRKENEK